MRQNERVISQSTDLHTAGADRIYYGQSTKEDKLPCSAWTSIIKPWLILTRLSPAVDKRPISHRDRGRGERGDQRFFKTFLKDGIYIFKTLRLSNTARGGFKKLYCTYRTKVRKQAWKGTITVLRTQLRAKSIFFFFSEVEYSIVVHSLRMRGRVIPPSKSLSPLVSVSIKFCFATCDVPRLKRMIAP